MTRLNVDYSNRIHQIITKHNLRVVLWVSILGNYQTRRRSDPILYQVMINKIISLWAKYQKERIDQRSRVSIASTARVSTFKHPNNQRMTTPVSATSHPTARPKKALFPILPSTQRRGTTRKNSGSSSEHGSSKSRKRCNSKRMITSIEMPFRIMTEPHQGGDRRVLMSMSSVPNSDPMTPSQTIRRRRMTSLGKVSSQ